MRIFQNSTQRLVTRENTFKRKKETLAFAVMVKPNFIM